MLGVDLNEGAYFRELRGDVDPPQKIAGLIRPLQRLRTLFAQEAVFDDGNLEFIRTQASLFGIGDFDRIGTTMVQRVELFRKLLEPRLTGDEAVPDRPRETYVFFIAGAKVRAPAAAQALLTRL